MVWLAYSALGVAKRVQLTTQPSGALVNQVFTTQPVGRLVDGSGVLSRTTGTTVTVSKLTGAGTLSGTLSVQTVEGVFTFTDLKLSATAASVTLQFTSSGLTSVTSTAFAVTTLDTSIGIQIGSYTSTGTAVTLTRGPYMMRQDATGTYAVTGAAVTLTGPAGPYFNDHVSISTREPVDANTLLAEDFSRGSWYTKNCDDANGSGGLSQAGVEGWCGNIYHSVDNAGVVNLGGGEYAGTTSTISGTDGMMADRNLTEPVTELWVRFYFKPLAGYTFGAEKVLTFNADGTGSGGIKWGNWSWNCANGQTSSGGCTMGIPLPVDQCFGQNYSITSGTWHCFILHMKLNTLVGTSNGEFHCWANACGTGTFPVNPGGSPTLRYTNTAINYPRNSTGEKITTLWFECWSNPNSSGERYMRSIYASKVALGFATNP